MPNHRSYMLLPLSQFTWPISFNKCLCPKLDDLFLNWLNQEGFLEIKHTDGKRHNILEPMLELPSEKESKTTVDSKNLVEPLKSR
jgi:hypothetical protein